MGDFFHGWRRKIGVVTLVLACVFMGAWLRSLYICDEIRIPSRDPTFHLIFTLPHWFGWVLVENSDGGISPQNRSLITRFEANSHLYSTSYRPYRMVYGRVDADDKYAKSMEASPHVYLSYWAVVFPLTSLSAWLLLTKSHQSIQKKIVEPIPAEGT